MFPSKRYIAKNYVHPVREVVYCDLSEDFKQHQCGFVFEWGMRMCGFGQFWFQLDEESNTIQVDTECMRAENVERVLLFFCKNNSPDKWPTLLRAFATPRNFLNHCEFH